MSKGCNFIAHLALIPQFLIAAVCLPFFLQISTGLTPRTKGFSHVMKHIDPKLIPYIYDVTCVVNSNDGGPATISNLLMGRKTVGELYIRRFKTDEIPNSSADESAQFLMNIYKDKDALLDSYALTGSFTQENTFQQHPVSMFPRRIYSLLNTVFWSTLIIPCIGKEHTLQRARKLKKVHAKKLVISNK